MPYLLNFRTVTFLVLLAMCALQPLRALAFECPKNTVPVGEPPPDGEELYCVQAGTGELKIRHGAYRRWHASGQRHTEGTFIMGERDGVWVNYYPTGQMQRREVFHRGIKNGKFETWHSNGNKKVEEIWVRGRRQGARKTWTQEGNPVMKESFVDGKRVGPAQFWNKNGKLKSSGFFDRSGKRDGVWTFFDQAGQRTAEGRYRAGKKDGRWRAWNPDGTIRSVTVYKDGKKGKVSKGKGDRGNVQSTRGDLTTIPETKYGERDEFYQAERPSGRGYAEDSDLGTEAEPQGTPKGKDGSSTGKDPSAVEPPPVPTAERRSYQELLKEWQEEKGLLLEEPENSQPSADGKTGVPAITIDTAETGDPVSDDDQSPEDDGDFSDDEDSSDLEGEGRG